MRTSVNALCTQFGESGHKHLTARPAPLGLRLLSHRSRVRRTLKKCRRFAQCRGDTWHPKKRVVSTAMYYVEIARPCVMVLMCTLILLRFSTRLEKGARTLRFKWVEQ
jgi:hypothetical protein